METVCCKKYYFISVLKRSLLKISLTTDLNIVKQAVTRLDKANSHKKHKFYVRGIFIFAKKTTNLHERNKNL